MKSIHGIAFVLVIIGGINWLLIGLFDWGIEMVIPSMLAKIIFILVGVSAVYLIVTHKKTCKCCDKSMASTPSM